MKQLILSALALISMSAVAQQNVKIHVGENSYSTTVDYITFDDVESDNLVDVADLQKKQAQLKSDNEKLQAELSRLKYTEYEMVDLGLSVMWATRNVGALTPEDYGDYYAWGETETKSIYDWGSYKFMQEGKSEWNYITKYTVPDNLKLAIWYEDDNFGGDNQTTLKPEDDVAYVKLGSAWRMPTIDEWKELIDSNNCDWTWDSNKKGYKVTSKKEGYVGNSIFLPAAGYREGSDSHGGGGFGCYWSTSIFTTNSACGLCLYFYSDYSNKYIAYEFYRQRGLSARPVADKNVPK